MAQCKPFRETASFPSTIGSAVGITRGGWRPTFRPNHLVLRYKGEGGFQESRETDIVLATL